MRNRYLLWYRVLGIGRKTFEQVALYNELDNADSTMIISV